MQWYYAQQGESKGPVEEAELKRLAADGQIKPTDHVWNRTMGDNWVPASSVPGLFEATAPPPAGPVPADHLQDGISYRAPARAAWARMKWILFQPFSIGKWFVLGFSAWLATLGQGGGSSFSGNLNEARQQRNLQNLREFDVDQLIRPIRQFWAQYGDAVFLFGIALAIIAIVLGLLIIWLRARGKFIFLDNVLHNRAEIVGPWREFAQHGNSLFGWYILYQVACVLIFAIMIGLLFLSVGLPWLRTGRFLDSFIPNLAMLGTLWLLIAVVLAYVSRFVEDFIIPISCRFDLTVWESWSRFRALYRAHTRAFLLYGLFYLWLRIVAGLCVLVFVVITCCVGGCLMAIPYIGAVVLLPLTVFFRAFSVEFLAQFGGEYRMFD